MPRTRNVTLKKVPFDQGEAKKGGGKDTRCAFERNKLAKLSHQNPKTLLRKKKP